MLNLDTFYVVSMGCLWIQVDSTHGVAISVHLVDGSWMLGLIAMVYIVEGANGLYSWGCKVEKILVRGQSRNYLIFWGAKCINNKWVAQM